MKFNVICRLCGAVLAITCLGAVPQSYAAQEDTAVGVSAPSAADSGAQGAERVGSSDAYLERSRRELSIIVNELRLISLRNEALAKDVNRQIRALTEAGQVLDVKETPAAVPVLPAPVCMAPPRASQRTSLLVGVLAALLLADILVRVSCHLSERATRQVSVHGGHTLRMG